MEKKSFYEETRKDYITDHKRRLEHLRQNKDLLDRLEIILQSFQELKPTMSWMSAPYIYVVVDDFRKLFDILDALETISDCRMTSDWAACSERKYYFKNGVCLTAELVEGNACHRRVIRTVIEERPEYEFVCNG